MFGETNLDFTDADISGVVTLDISQAFGEVNLTVPKSWRVATDLSQFLGETRDQRQAINPITEREKVLLITGNSVFGVVKIN